MFAKITNVFRKIRHRIAADVPADMAACEFDCRTLECPDEAWENCARRQEEAEATQSFQQNNIVQ